MANEERNLGFFDNLLFTKIFQTFRMAMQPSKLIIAFLAVVVICLAGWVMDFSDTVVARGNGDTELQVYMADPGQLDSFIKGDKETSERRGVFSTLWDFSTRRFHNTINSLLVFDLAAVKKNVAELFKAIGWALKYHLLYSIIFFAIKLAVICVAGGAICRIAALQIAQGEKPGLTQALRYSSKKFMSFFIAPLMPIGIIVVIGLFIFVLGLTGNVRWVGELIIGISAPLALLAGLLIAVFLVGVVAGFNLMFPAVAYDGSDCFDAMSSSFWYIYVKPWRMSFYTITAAVYGAVCYTVVRLFAFLLLLAVHFFLSLGIWSDSSSKEVNKVVAIWPEPSFANLLDSAGSVAVETNWSESFAAFLVHLWLLVIVGLLISFVISFYFSANTIIYSLMRKKVDNVEVTDVYTEVPSSEKPQNKLGTNLENSKTESSANKSESAES